MAEVRVVRYPLYLRYALVVGALAAYFPVHYLILLTNPDLDGKVISLISLAVVAMGGFVAEISITQRKGVTLRFSWNAKQNVLHVSMYRRFSNIGHLKLRVADYYGSAEWLGVQHIKQELMAFFGKKKSFLKSEGEVRLVGVGADDCQILRRLINRAVDEG